ncbi:MAG: phosphoribosylformylglycinamidine synthase subunit PurQ [Acidobacteriota bacterium]
MKAGVVVFPGSNCDHDCYHVLKHVLGCDTVFLWHDGTDLDGCDLILLPGGFAYGDYLRAGAMAAHASIMTEVRRHAERGGLVLGICNGFQMLTEAGMLPGALCRNAAQRFLCQDVYLRVERDDTPYTHGYEQGQVLRMPISHAEGRYDAPAEIIDDLENEGRVVFRYVDASGAVTEAGNPNGSKGSIAGIINPAGNVLGMMPHPDRCAEAILGGDDGLALFTAAIEHGVQQMGAS